ARCRAALSRRAGSTRRRRADMRARLALCLALCAASLPADAQDLAPFLPAPKAPRLVKMLAPTDFIDRASIEAFERDAGWIVALGGPPLSFAQALGLAREPRRASGCGVAWPDAAEESFLIAWRLSGRDPASATAADVKSAAALLARARANFQAFAVSDEVGALARGSGCRGAGTAAEAAAAVARGGDAAPPIRFAYPREGAPLTLYAFAIPRDAAAPEAAYRLIDAMLAPEAAQ